MKIFIYGGPGSGKSTLAQQLSGEFNIPFFELDDLFHSGEKSKEIKDVTQRTKIVEQLLKQENSWIIEGLYRDNWLNEILNTADIVFYLNTPYLTRAFRATRRTLGWMVFRNSKRTSSPLTVAAHLKLNRRFETVHRPEFNKRLAAVKKQSITITSYKDAVNAIKDVASPTGRIFEI